MENDHPQGDREEGIDVIAERGIGRVANEDRVNIGRPVDDNQETCGGKRRHERGGSDHAPHSGKGASQCQCNQAGDEGPQRSVNDDFQRASRFKKVEVQREKSPHDVSADT